MTMRVLLQIRLDHQTAALDRALSVPEPLRARQRAGLAGQARAASRNPAAAIAGAGS